MYIRALFLGASLVTGTAAQAANSCDVRDQLNRPVLENVAVMEIPRSIDPEAIAAAQSALQSGDVDKARNALNALSFTGVPTGGEVLGYTRLRIEFTPCEPTQVRSYAAESRSPLARFLIGKTDNHVLKFDADVEPLGVKASSQLYSMLRNSAKDGQSWTTDIRNDDYLLPYFRVDRASVLNFSANFQSQGSSKFQIGSTILDIVERGSKFITPSALLITDENKPRFNDAATFVDESLSNLFNIKITETARQGIPIAPSENARQHLVSVLLMAPNPIKTLITPQAQGRTIGRWDIYAEPLLKSLFAPVTNGIADVSKLDPTTVLNLKIGDKEVLRDRLAASEAITKAAQSVAKATKDNVGEPAIGLCRLVAMEAARVGLAPTDVALAAWAYLADQAMVKKKHDAAAAACQAIPYFPH